ncbi:MAG: FtsX-like permease family protein, partial [Dehalococcoidia bacterium]
QAIRTGYLSDQRRIPLLARLPLPGRTTAQLPLRNLLRAPRRTVMTVLGVVVSITVLVGVVGMVDSFVRTIDLTRDELSTSAPRRVTVDLESFSLASSETVEDIVNSPLVDAAESHLRVGGTISAHGTSIDVLLQLLPLHDAIWSPTIEQQRSPRGDPGIVLSRKAADDLAVEPGEVITLRHPLRVGLTSYRFVTSDVRVIGLSAFPTRFTTFMDLHDASIMGLDGITNTVIVDPAPGVGLDELERTLFSQPGVASVQPVREYTSTIRKEIDRFLGILTIVEAAVLLLALLIAFNSASINADERRRDHATMFAYGLPTRTVMRMAIEESAFVGVLGTATGVLVGWGLLGWLVNRLLPQTFPDLGITTYIATSTLLTALLLGVLAVAVAPLFTLRKLRHMDIPSTLRVME